MLHTGDDHDAKLFLSFYPLNRRKHIAINPGNPSTTQHYSLRTLAIGAQGYCLDRDVLSISLNAEVDSLFLRSNLFPRPDAFLIRSSLLLHSPLHCSEPSSTVASKLAPFKHIHSSFRGLRRVRLPDRGRRFYCNQARKQVSQGTFASDWDSSCLVGGPER